MWFNKPTPITVRTDLSLDDCLRRLRDETDEARRSIFSFSGYKGSKPVLSTFDGTKFRVWKRRINRNSFAPIFFGTLEQQNRGTVVRGFFDADPWSKYFIKGWLVLAVLIGTPIFLEALGGRTGSDRLVGLTVPPFFILWGALLPEFGRWIGKSQERYLLDFLESALLARRDHDGLSARPQFDNRPIG
jgi:hypothetical protein